MRSCERQGQRSFFLLQTQLMFVQVQSRKLRNCKLSTHCIRIRLAFTQSQYTMVYFKLRYCFYFYAVGFYFSTLYVPLSRTTFPYFALSCSLSLQSRSSPQNMWDCCLMTKGVGIYNNIFDKHEWYRRNK